MLVKITDYRGEKPIKRYVNVSKITDATAWKATKHPEAAWLVQLVYISSSAYVLVSDADMELIAACSEPDHG
jgi:hypothetical protein